MRQSALSIDHFNHIIDSIATLTNEARQRHFQRWPILGQYIWPNAQPIPTSYEGEIIALKNWLTARLQWIDYNIPNAGACENWQDFATEDMLATVYPNPNNGSDVTIKLRIREAQTVHLKVYDNTGRLVHSQTINGVPVSNFVAVGEMSKWQTGIYYFVFTGTRGNKSSVKVIKH